MPDVNPHFLVERDIYPERASYALLRDIDKTVRELSNDMYSFRKEITSKVSALEKTQEKHSQYISELKQDTAALKNDVTELKQEVKDLRRDVSDIKGDIKVLAAGFGAAQNRFNWGLVILGIIVALIQLLK